MSDTYILQVDLPDGAKKGDEYKFSPQTIEYWNVSRPTPSKTKWSPKFVEHNPTFFTKKEPYAEIIKTYSDKKYVIEYHEINQESPSTLDARTGIQIFDAVLASPIRRP